MGNQVKIYEDNEILLFNIRLSTKIFLVGTKIDDDILERFDDMEFLGLKSFIKLSSIHFFF
jgi:hypothetical protein